MEGSNEITPAETQENDPRGKGIEAQRGDRVLIGSFFLCDNGTKVAWNEIDPKVMDTDIFGACLSQLMANFMANNPEVGMAKIMSSFQNAMAALMASQTEESNEGSQ